MNHLQLTDLLPCPFCGHLAGPASVAKEHAKDPVSCRNEPFLYDQPERGGCHLARFWFERDVWQKQIAGNKLRKLEQALAGKEITRFRIPGPGEYRTRDGRHVRVRGAYGHKAAWYGWDAKLNDQDWSWDGISQSGDKGLDIIGHWQEAPPSWTAEDGRQKVILKPGEIKRMNSKRINDIIDSLPVCADGKQKVRELVKEIKPDFEVQPEVKAGQVWAWSNRIWWIILSVHKERTVLSAQPLANPEYIPQVNIEGTLKSAGKFLANTLDEYYAKKARGEV